MESNEVFLYTFLTSHYLFTVLFVAWLFVAGVPTEISNYGLQHWSRPAWSSVRRDEPPTLRARAGRTCTLVSWRRAHNPTGPDITSACAQRTVTLCCSSWRATDLVRISAVSFVAILTLPLLLTADWLIIVTGSIFCLFVYFAFFFTATIIIAIARSD